jgi:DNA (cytosine-5)-methyltransferase 1
MGSSSRTKAYYNENDPKAAAWLRELIKDKQIAYGEVDERSIEDVYPADLNGFSQHHFFAGIGGWSYALRLADWPDDRAVWTGSCPCQPFSQAGKGKGFADERHLWPAWFHLIEQQKPTVIFGEQVASKAGLAWIDLVQADLEAQGYSFGASDLSAAGVGAPHIRQRLYWLADFNGKRLKGRGQSHGKAKQSEQQASRRIDIDRRGASICEWIYCTDGKYRPIESGTFPLADGVSGRVGLLRGYGNAIVPQVAEQFIRSYAEST